MAAQFDAALERLHRGIQLQRSAFQAADDLVELRQSVLERKLADIVGRRYPA